MTAPRNVHGMVPVNGQLLVAIGATGSVRAALVAQPFAVACAGRVTVHLNAGPVVAVLSLAAEDAHRLARVLLVAARACGEPAATPPIALIRGGPPKENAPEAAATAGRGAMATTTNATEFQPDSAGSVPACTDKRRAALRWPPALRCAGSNCTRWPQADG